MEGTEFRLFGPECPLFGTVFPLGGTGSLLDDTGFPLGVSRRKPGYWELMQRQQQQQEEEQQSECSPLGHPDTLLGWEKWSMLIGAAHGDFNDFNICIQKLEDRITTQSLSLGSFLAQAVDYRGRNVLHIAARHKAYDIINFCVSPERFHASELSTLWYDFVNKRDDIHGSTPLHDAVRADDADAVNCLVRAGADMTVRDHEGHTPERLAFLHGMCRKAHILRTFSMNPADIPATPGDAAKAVKKALAEENEMEIEGASNGVGGSETMGGDDRERDLMNEIMLARTNNLMSVEKMAGQLQQQQRRQIPDAEMAEADTLHLNPEQQREEKKEEENSYMEDMELMTAEREVKIGEMTINGMQVALVEPFGGLSLF